jgi:hypothetical protein
MHSQATDARRAEAQRFFEKPLLVAAVLSIPATILQTTQVSDPWGTIGTVLNWVIWTAFLAELVVMLVIQPDRRSWS